MYADSLSDLNRELSWVKIYNVDHRYEANRIEGTYTYVFNACSIIYVGTLKVLDQPQSKAIQLT